MRAAGLIAANQQAVETAQEGAEQGRVAIEQARERARVATQQALEQAREQAGMDMSAAKGAPPAFRDALERAGLGSQSTADNAGHSAPRNSGTTVR